MIALLFSFLAYFLESYPLCFLAAGFWAMFECYQTSVVSAVCSEDYPGKPEIFSVLRIFWSAGVGVTIIISILMDNVALWSFITLVYCCMIISIIFSFLMRKP
jgi:hypothetical protein